VRGAARHDDRLRLAGAAASRARSPSLASVASGCRRVGLSSPRAPANFDLDRYELEPERELAPRDVDGRVQGVLKPARLAGRQTCRGGRTVSL
jgi:hypothetical protein